MYPCPEPVPLSLDSTVLVEISLICQPFYLFFLKVFFFNFYYFSCFKIISDNIFWKHCPEAVPRGSWAVYTTLPCLSKSKHLHLHPPRTKGRATWAQPCAYPSNKLLIRGGRISPCSPCFWEFLIHTSLAGSDAMVERSGSNPSIFQKNLWGGMAPRCLYTRWHLGFFFVFHLKTELDFGDWKSWWGHFWYLLLSSAPWVRLT